MLIKDLQQESLSKGAKYLNPNKIKYKKTTAATQDKTKQ